MADDAFVLRQIVQVELALGVELSPERRAAVARTLLAKRYRRIDLEAAALALSADVELDRKLRFGGAFSAADFARMIDGDPEDAKAKAGKLMTYAEANADALRRRLGIELYRPVRVEGQPNPLWTLP